MRRDVIAALAACAALLAAGAHAADPRDPLESFNRPVDAFNRRVDQAAVSPVAKAYERAVPGLVRSGVSNFFANLGDVWSAANSVLQLKPGDAAQNWTRFAVNTVFGLGGVLDIATDAGIERHKEDFGTTLARWSVPPGPYVVLPLLGPSTLRDTAALPVDFVGHPLGHVSPAADRIAIGAAGAVDARARPLPLDTALDQALDRYTFMRDAYLQHREAQVHRDIDSGGDVPVIGAAADETAQAGEQE
jgi:phospholipid-binding lipoprotein MlaA